VAARGLRNAIRLVKAFSGELLVLTVVPEVSWLSAAVETGSWSQALVEHDQRWREGFEEFLKKQDFGDIRWSPEIRGGDPARQIVAAAADFACDALVMGATGRSGLLHVLMGSVTRRVLQHLPCSVLTVHDEDMLLEELTEADVRTNNLLYVEAKALLETQAYEAALVKFDQVLARNPFHVPALEGRAEACEHLGQSERAERCRRRAVVLRHETWV
jgi:nucleotide-binding universal stress UspA family protein